MRVGTKTSYALVCYTQYIILTEIWYGHKLKKADVAERDQAQVKLEFIVEIGAEVESLSCN